jgi:hypothetical protein
MISTILTTIFERESAGPVDFQLILAVILSFPIVEHCSFPLETDK